MPQTKLTNLVNPQVMADMVSARLPKKIKFTPIARIDNTLVGRPGNTITVPKYA
jgi:N4-gp56 family major capsid protein